MIRLDASRPIVVKLGGAADVRHDAALADVAREVQSGATIVVVHGGSGEADRLSREVGHPPRVLRSPSGHESRYTDPRTRDLFVMATALVNRRIVGALQAAGVDAVGLSGLDGRTLTGERKETIRTVEDGRVRVVRDDWSGRITAVEPRLLRALLDAGHVPVVAPLAMTAAGEPLNVDGDRVAAALATALDASALVLLTGAPGLLRAYPDVASLVERAGAEDLPELLECARGRMKRKVLAAGEALEGGVPAVVIASAAGDAPLSAALAGGGTHFLAGAAVAR